MIRSMTGYGRASETRSGRDITVELRSVNNRFFDCAVKLPRSYLFCESTVKERLKQAVARGKIDVYISVVSNGAETQRVEVNEPLLDSYLEALRSMMERCALRDDLSVMQLAKMPDVLTVVRAEEDPEGISADICAVLETALAEYIAMCETEGGKLLRDLEERLTVIEEITGRIEARSPQTVEEYRARLTAKMEEVLQNTAVDEGRILTEAAIYADKIAVDEETVRLRSHVSQLRTMLETGGVIGRKADFLIQELNREANTIGSKCNDIEIGAEVIALKAEIEKMREQMQNIE